MLIWDDFIKRSIWRQILRYWEAVFMEPFLVFAHNVTNRSSIYGAVSCVECLKEHLLRGGGISEGHRLWKRSQKRFPRVSHIIPSGNAFQGNNDWNWLSSSFFSSSSPDTSTIHTSKAWGGPSATGTFSFHEREKYRACKGGFFRSPKVKRWSHVLVIFHIVTSYQNSIIYDS